MAKKKGKGKSKSAAAKSKAGKQRAKAPVSQAAAIQSPEPAAAATEPPIAAPTEQQQITAEAKPIVDAVPADGPFHKRYAGEIILGGLVCYVILLVLATISELFDLGWFRFDWLIR